MSIRLRRTKIITTLGPATDLDNNLEKVISSGANVVRLNFSHGTEKDHIIRAKKVREISYKLGLYVAIICDLQGPKIRISKFINNKIVLNVSDTFILDASLSTDNGNNKHVGIDYKNLPNEVFKDDILLIDDGRIHLKVIKINNMRIYTKVIVGGNLSNNKGINKLGGGLSANSLTQKDKKDIITAAKIGVDYIAISFVRSCEELRYARSLLKSAGSKAKIISKIERAEAVSSDKTLDNIIIASDVVMVARGDLGVEIGYPELLKFQKKIISRSRKLNRAVITATQMMESMINNPIPTRAEVMDVANAVIDGTDAVMLSAETAIGKYPSETVKIMSNICLGAEKIASISNNRMDIKLNSIEETIAMSAMYAANHLNGIKAIISITESLNTAILMSRISSFLPIFAISRNKNTLNLSSIYRGVNPFYYELKTGVISESFITNLLKKYGFLFTGDLVIITKCDLINIEDMTNTFIIFKVE